MRVNLIKKGIKPILALLLFFSVTFVVFSQDKPEDENKRLREEILAVYQTKGEQGLRDFMKKKKNQITNTFIVDFAKAGVKERKEEWLKVCEIMAEEKRDEKNLADVYCEMGKYFRLISDYKNAIDCFEKSLTIYVKTDDLIGQGEVYKYKGMIYFFTGNSDKASEMYEKALELFNKAKHPIGKGNVYMCIGIINFYKGLNDQAMKMYEKASLFYKQAGDVIGQGNIFRFKGNIYFYTGENMKALKMYDKAIPYYEKVEEILSIGNVYLNKGDIYKRIADYSKAHENYNKALPLFEKSKSPLGIGNIYDGKGSIYLEQGDYLKALEMYDKALIFFKKTGEPRSQGGVYKNKGIIYYNIGDYSKTLEMCDKASYFLEKFGEPRRQGSLYLIRGDVYYQTGLDSKALKFYDKAFHLFNETKYPIGQGNACIRSAIVYSYIGEYSRAIEMYNKALQFFEKAGLHQGQGDVYFGKGYNYFLIGDNSRAIEMYDKALPFYEKADSFVGQGNVYHCEGDIYFIKNDNQKALKMYYKALDLYKKYGDILSEGYILFGIARLLVSQGKKNKALVNFEKGMFYIEKVRNQIAFSEMKKGFMEEVYDKYRGAVLFLLENKYYEKAFKYAESMRSRVFLDRMAEGLVRLDKGLPHELKEKRDNLVTKLSLLSKDIHQTAGGKDEKKLQELKEKYRQVENEFEELLIKIRLKNPLYASIRYPEPITVRELQKVVLKKREILVRYFISPDRLYVFLVSKKIFNVVPLDVTNQEIKGLVEEHLRAIKENDSFRMKRYGKILYEKIFKPLEKKIKKSKDIIIIPDGELATIPFESFIVDNKGQDRPVFLLEKYRVKYLQSASLLKILRRHYQNNSETNSFIGFGDPVYDYENFKQGKPEKGGMKILATENTEITEGGRIANHQSPLHHSTTHHSTTLPLTNPPGDEIKEIHRDRYARAGGIMDRLPASGEEVKTIARLFEKESQKSVIHLREEATEDNAGSPGMKDFDYIHFTCHGLLNDNFQSLVLSQLPPDKSKEDGYFTLNEIMNCDYNAELVVLSACRTGSGKLERAEGVTGMTRAVMYAGTPAVAASLWDVDDIATKELMLHFYRNMLEKNLDKAEALRQAKLELLKNKKYRSPLFWSAFVMYGE